MASTVEMIDTSSQGIRIRYYSTCMKNVMQETNKCENLKVNDTVEFIVSIEVNQVNIEAIESTISRSVVFLGHRVPDSKRVV